MQRCLSQSYRPTDLTRCNCPTYDNNKELSCRREDARCFMSLPPYVHYVPKTCDYVFNDNLNYNCPFSTIFGALITDSISHRQLFYFFTVPISCIYCTLRNCRDLNICKQELSYSKQIARQLRTQYVESIYRPKYYT